MVWPHPPAPPNRASGVAYNHQSRSEAREQEPGEPQANPQEQGSAKSQADSQLELSEIAAQLASIQATVATIRDTQNQQGELLRISLQQIDDKITSLHSVSRTEIRAIVERLETSAQKNSVDLENTTTEPAPTDPEPDRIERQKKMTHTRAEAKKRGEISAVLWVGGFSGHADIQRQRHSVF